MQAVQPERQPCVEYLRTVGLQPTAQCFGLKGDDHAQQPDGAAQGLPLGQGRTCQGQVHFHGLGVVTDVQDARRKGQCHFRGVTRAQVHHHHGDGQARLLDLAHQVQAFGKRVNAVTRVAQIPGYQRLCFSLHTAQQRHGGGKLGGVIWGQGR